MSTRAVIAMPTGDDPLPAADARPRTLLARLFRVAPRPRFAGVYHHNGGAPDELGRTLFELVTERYDRDVARLHRELIVDNAAGWSSIHALGDPAARRRWDGRAKLTAGEYFARGDDDSGLPVTYQGDPQRDLGFRAPPVHDASPKMGAAYVYVVCRDELVIFGVGADDVALREAARVRWDSTPDWTALREQIDKVLDDAG